MHENRTINDFVMDGENRTKSTEKLEGSLDVEDATNRFENDDHVTMKLNITRNERPLKQQKPIGKITQELYTQQNTELY